MNTYEHLWTSMNIYEHLWTSMTIYDNLWTSMMIICDDVEEDSTVLPQWLNSMGWQKRENLHRKPARFSHEDHGIFRYCFPTKPINLSLRTWTWPYFYYRIFPWFPWWFPFDLAKYVEMTWVFPVRAWWRSFHCVSFANLPGRVLLHRCAQKLPKFCKKVCYSHMKSTESEHQWSTGILESLSCGIPGKPTQNWLRSKLPQCLTHPETD